jgi:hypothetical protein
MEIDQKEMENEVFCETLALERIMNIGLMYIPHFVSRCKGEAGLIEEYPSRVCQVRAVPA